MTLVCKIFDSIRSNDQDFMTKHSAMIKQMFETDENVYTECSCGCDESCTVMSILTCQVDSYDHNDDRTLTKNQNDRLDALKFLVENGIVDPNFIFTAPHEEHIIMTIDSTREIMLSRLFRHFCGWNFELQRLDYIFEKTSLDHIKNFRTEDGESLFHCIFYGHSFPPPDILKKWIGIFEKAGFDWKCETRDKENLLMHAVNSVDTYMVQFFVNKGLDVNGTWGEYRHYANCLQYLLYDMRYTKNQKFLDDIADITEMLVDAGIDLCYTSPDGRNVMDYLHRYGWYGTRTYNIIKSRCKKNVTGSIPAPDKYPFGPKVAKYSSMSEEMKLLFDNRYEKDPTQLGIIVTNLKNIDVDSLRLRDSEGDGIYSSYCSNGYWRGSEVYDYLSSIFYP